ncbi:MAG: hypothetical protein K0Q55_3014, partial [Verrucomicrobia bacterium]|nr:hypothetical protein [Verrucomicrobiota bacterium]
LVMLQSSTLQVLQETESPYTITLATNISQFTLEFWDDQAQDWAYEWLETNSIPRMVRVALAFGGQNNTYQSAPTTETKTIYLAGTAITKEIQFPTPTRAGGGGGGPGQGGGGPGRGGAGGGPGRDGNGNPTIRIGPDGRPIIQNPGGPGRPGGGGGEFRPGGGGNFNPGGGQNGQGGPRIPGSGQSSPKGGRR